MGLVDKLRAKYELYCLEQRYTRRDKRTTFCSDARYVDGEYVHHNNTSDSGSLDRSSSGGALSPSAPSFSGRTFGGLGQGGSTASRPSYADSQSPLYTSSASAGSKRMSRIFSAPASTRIKSGWQE